MRRRPAAGGPLADIPAGRPGRALPPVVGVFLGLAVMLAMAASLGSCGVWNRVFPGDNAARTETPAPGGRPSGPASLQVKGGLASGGVAPVESSLTSSFRTVWVASFLDPEPAQKSAAVFRRQGLAAFTVRKTLVEKGLVGGSPIGDYHLVMVGLFGEHKEAEDLGKYLQARAMVTNWQVTGSDDPGEIGQSDAQTAPLVARSDRVVEAAEKKAARPVAPDDPAATGEAFKGLVRGRFVGSYRDYQEARLEAGRLTASGWPASVDSDPSGGGKWYRVVLAEPSDRRDFSAPPAELAAARASAARTEGVVLLVDTSGVKGVWGAKAPAADRRDASACAGYSEAGRLLTGLERLVGYIPERGLLAAVKPVTYREPSSIVDRVTRSARNWWTGDDSDLAEVKSVYGPAIFNRAELMSRVRGLSVSPDPAPLGPALDGLNELAAISGQKIVVLFSEFGLNSSAQETLAAMGRLKGTYGDSLRLLVVYGDTDDAGWRTAEAAAKAAGSGEAWNGCMLLSDNNYFEKFVKSVFRR
ncbi:MAG: hypothetical protein LBO05_00435 [Deltaproteobacteria bacterium]|nr:hypothetical protein [Deltaproteobacteria bacterium]